MNAILWGIAACEVGFWVLLAAGLSARYLLRRRGLGAALLVCVPLVDLVLLVFTVVDLRGGAVARSTHGLAAAYIGFSVAFGPSMLAWADQRFAYRFAGGPPPVRPPRYGMARARHDWRITARCALAAALTSGTTFVLLTLVDAPERTGELRSWLTSAWIVPAFSAVVSASYTLWPKKDPAGRRVPVPTEPDLSD